MASFEIEWKRSAAKELRKLPKDVMARIVAAVEELAIDPHPPGARKLKGPSILIASGKAPIELFTRSALML